ncbi:hypothetical protein [Nocardioides sp.]|uniref:hypothetical protein n=1 Tax=Nocardioides sp. TaxID=35761 RepID=UPI00286E4B1A|nr:hypothetical protein [Nocardioides sp.]
MIGDRWGVTDAETREPYPCDDFVKSPSLVAWRGVTVDASPDVVWARVKQVRLAPYSYDLIDNLGRHSPPERRDLPDPVVGDRFTRAFGRDQGTVVAIEPGVHLTAQIMGAHMSYAVRGHGSQTRLLLKVTAATRSLLAPALCLGDLVMARKQLLRLAALAEADERAG